MSKEERGRGRRALGQFSADDQQEREDQHLTTSTTIVGGQPPKRKHVTVNVPVGVERALFLAAQEPDFRQELLRDRGDAARARGLTLRDSEAALLRAAPAAQLEAFVDSLDVSPANVKRRAFMGAVAASAAALASGGALGCGDDDVKTDSRGFTPDTGIRSDGVPVDSDGVRVDAGVRDQLPMDVPPYKPDMGILPDTLPADVPVAYPDAGVPIDVSVAYPDMGIKPDTSND